VAQLFISYRRTDAGGHAGRLHTLLLSHYAGDDVFFDVAGIEDGRNWEAEIKQHLGKCDVLLVVIGPDWLSACDPESHQRRIDQPGDWVRLEVEAGLEMNKEVIPVLVGGAQLPAKKEFLPATIQELLAKQAREIPHKDTESAVRLLVEQLKKRFSEIRA
jgi:TIR domain